MPDSPFFLNYPPISSYLNLTINNQNTLPTSITASDDYSRIVITIPKTKMVAGSNNIVIRLADLTSNMAESVILESGEISHVYVKPHEVAYEFTAYEPPQVFRMKFIDYKFYSVSNLHKYLYINFTGYNTLSFSVNETELTLIDASTLEIVLLVPINESIYDQEVTIDAMLWNTNGVTGEPPLTPLTSTVIIGADVSGDTIFYVSRTGQVAAMGTAVLCFVSDSLTLFDKSSYLRFYALMVRVSLFRYINIYFHPLTVGFFQEMDLDITTIPKFFITMVGMEMLRSERNRTILNVKNNVGYYDVFLQGYGGTALLQGVLLLSGTLVAIAHEIIIKKAPKKIFWTKHLKKILVFNLNGVVVLATCTKLILGLSIYFQSANMGSSFASGSFAVACIYVVGFIAVIIILIKNAKNQKDEKNEKFFQKVGVLRHDFKDTVGGRLAPLIFTLVLLLGALFTGVVGASGKAQVAALTVFSVFACVFWIVAQSFQKKSETILMIFSEVCFSLSAFLLCYLSIDSVDLETRLALGWTIMVVFSIFIAVNLFYRSYELIALVRKKCKERREAAERKRQANINMFKKNIKGKGRRISRTNRDILNLSNSSSAKSFLEGSREFDPADIGKQQHLRFPNQLEKDDDITNWHSSGKSTKNQPDCDPIQSPNSIHLLHQLQPGAQQESTREEPIKRSSIKSTKEAEPETSGQTKKKKRRRFVIEAGDEQKNTKFWKIKGGK